MIKRYIVLSISIALLLSISSCSNKDNQTENKDGLFNKAFTDNIKTTKAILSDQEEELVLTGKVDYNPDNVVHYIPLVTGVVEKTYFSLGDKVQKGQVLADIKSSELNSLQAELISTESNLKIAKRELQSAQEMFADNMLSERELMEAKAKVEQTEAELVKTKREMSVFGEGKSNGTFSIKAPMSGYIVNKNISSGSQVSGDGEPLFTVADLNNVWIIVNVYPGNVSLVKEGMDVNIKILSYPNETFSGKINALSHVLDPEEKVLKARVVMPNADMKLKPDMLADIRLKNYNNSKLIAVPTEALIFDNDKYFVVVRESDDQFKAVEVIPQGHNNKMTYIKSEISEGEDVVVKNQLLIHAGLNNK